MAACSGQNRLAAYLSTRHTNLYQSSQQLIDFLLLPKHTLVRFTPA